MSSYLSGRVRVTIPVPGDLAFPSHVMVTHSLPPGMIRKTRLSELYFMARFIFSRAPYKDNIDQRWLNFSKYYQIFHFQIEKKFISFFK